MKPQKLPYNIGPFPPPLKWVRLGVSETHDSYSRLQFPPLLIWDFSIQSYPSPWSRSSSLFLHTFLVLLLFSQCMNTQSSLHLLLRLINCFHWIDFHFLATPNHYPHFQPLACTWFEVSKSFFTHVSATIPAHSLMLIIMVQETVNLSLKSLSTSTPFLVPISSPTLFTRRVQGKSFVLCGRWWDPCKSKSKTYELPNSHVFPSLSPLFWPTNL